MYGGALVDWLYYRQEVRFMEYKCDALYLLPTDSQVRNYPEAIGAKFERADG